MWRCGWKRPLQIRSCTDVLLFWKTDTADDVDVPHVLGVSSPSSPEGFSRWNWIASPARRRPFGLCRARFALRLLRGCATPSPKVLVDGIGSRLQPVVALSGYAGHASPFGSCVAAPRVARRF